MKKTVAFDFDGVIHSYTSGWKGETMIPDPPVLGIREVIEDLRKDYLIAIFSTRAKTPQGQEAIAQYMIDHRIHFDVISAGKPIAICYVDDRAIHFDGITKGLAETIRQFKSWNEK